MLNQVICELQAIGVHVATWHSAGDGELQIISATIDAIGPSRVHEMMFAAYDAGLLSKSPFEIFVSAPQN